jgi:hypothetical protein
MLSILKKSFCIDSPGVGVKNAGCLLTFLCESGGKPADSYGERLSRQRLACLDGKGDIWKGTAVDCR